MLSIRRKKMHEDELVLLMLCIAWLLKPILIFSSTVFRVLYLFAAKGSSWFVCLIVQKFFVCLFVFVFVHFFSTNQVIREYKKPHLPLPTVLMIIFEPITVFQESHRKRFLFIQVAIKFIKKNKDFSERCIIM